MLLSSGGGMRRRSWWLVFYQSSGLHHRFLALRSHARMVKPSAGMIDTSPAPFCQNAMENAMPIAWMKTIQNTVVHFSTGGIFPNSENV